MTTLLLPKYYVRLKGAVDVRSCSRCGVNPATYLHTAWLVRWPTLCDACYGALVRETK